MVHMKYFRIDLIEYREKPFKEHHDEVSQIACLKAPSWSPDWENQNEDMNIA